MKTRLAVYSLSVCAFIAPNLFAQQWEFGGLGGGSFTKNQSVSGGALSGDIGMETGFAGGVYLGQSGSGHLGGEIRYLYEHNDLKLQSSGTKYTFGGHTHSIGYDLLWYFGSPKSSVRPYVAAGGGIKQYAGTGTEIAVQPLGNLAVLTKTQEWKPMVDFGGGIRFTAGKHMSFRVEVRDYLTPYPTKVLTPIPPAKVDGWLQNLTVLVGLGFVF